MSNIETLRFQETIRAPVEKVWDTMLDSASYSRWTAPFGEGARYEGSWEQGSRILFLVPSGDGMVAQIAENRRHEHISIRYLGQIVNGVEDTESDAVRARAPAYEKYTFTAVPGGSRVVVDQDVTAEWEQFMREAWPSGLRVLKQICEEKGPG